MRQQGTTFDVAVVGASLAGCTVAHLLGRGGLRVALVEKHGDPDAYKRLCGHFIQPCAAPTLERLGVGPDLLAAGAVPNGIDASTRWGWIRPRPAPGALRRHGWSLRRSKLDPLIRRRAVETPGVEYLGGQAAVALLGGDRCEGVRVRDRAGKETALKARLVVGADGRTSAVAKLAGVTPRARRNERFCYMAYHEDIERRQDGRGWLWMLEPDVLIVAPQDDGLTLVAAFPHKRHLARWKAAREDAFDRFARSVTGGPSLADARRVSPLVGYTHYPPLARPAVPRSGLALVGDAALTCDPTLAIGCGWALQSAEWLADAVTPALQGAEPLPRGLARYRRSRRALAGHARMIDAGALAKPASPVERLMLQAAVHDPAMARHFEEYVGRTIPVRRFLSPAALARAARTAVPRA